MPGCARSRIACARSFRVPSGHNGRMRAVACGSVPVRFFPSGRRLSDDVFVRAAGWKRGSGEGRIEAASFGTGRSSVRLHGVGGRRTDVAGEVFLWGGEFFLPGPDDRGAGRRVTAGAARFRAGASGIVSGREIVRKGGRDGVRQLGKPSALPRAYRAGRAFPVETVPETKTS